MGIRENVLRTERVIAAGGSIMTRRRFMLSQSWLISFSRSRMRPSPTKQSRSTFGMDDAMWMTVADRSLGLATLVDGVMSKVSFNTVGDVIESFACMKPIRSSVRLGNLIGGRCLNNMVAAERCRRGASFNAKFLSS